MLQFLVSILIFCIVLLLYLHVVYYLKVNNTLEVFHVNDYTKENVNRLCQLKQPFTFNYMNQPLLQGLNFDTLRNQYNKLFIQLRKKTEDLFLPVPVERGLQLFENDVSNNYYSENNEVFLKTSKLLQYCKQDNVLQPTLMSNHKFDVILGNSGANTKTKYNLYYRNFFYVTDGSCKLRLLPPNTNGRLNVNKNYELFEYNCKENVFDTNCKEPFVDVELKKGEIIFIPTYWFYSFQFKEKTIISSFHYSTYLSNLSIVPDVCKHVLQKQNINLHITSMKQPKQKITHNYVNKKNKIKQEKIAKPKTNSAKI